ncbi:WD-repeat protein WDR6, WD repeat superfamily [Aspergillus steynii IBT 23096]|uniref:WD-repeat protein WDR6, WD repeat superfamily n=1 Tax=Aspergillus steynii IBT 23096 TaxID=1392250 RepID=A0A2I2FY06_9EURO|nr:WD-repeat protein WDR6, WD repeat superfamily [Aspergillus steynii IBT 23096]PLB45502.1 WD-repeat protein WDR6, WD repeat superfamily [Aspergillus steynii IBT 23096]
MHSSLEHIDACLPITALKAFDLGDDSFVIEGQGPYVRLFDERTGKLLGSLEVFKRSNIHGFIVLGHEQRGKDASTRFLIWGGESLRVIDLSVTHDAASGEPEVSLRTICAEYVAPDWIMAGCVPEADTAEVRAYMVTAHNAVLRLLLMDGGSSEYEKSIHLDYLVAGVKTLLYSADTVSFSSSHILIAAGTVFGEIIVWSCFLEEDQSSTSSAVASIHHFFTGHEGSIFGVRISHGITSLPGRSTGRFLASCSDDRTIKIWDISDCQKSSRHDPSAYSTDGFDLRSTGFGDSALGTESCIASAFGHQARIWNVSFLPTQAGEECKLNLVSRGEDATCFVWDLSWDPSSEKSEFKLSEISFVRQHCQKHIWASDIRRAGTETMVYTGGADGALKVFKLEVGENGALVLPNRNRRINYVVDSHDAEPKLEKTMKKFGFVSPDCFVATTTQGEVQICRVESPASAERYISRETISVEEDLRSYCAIAGLPQYGLALLGNARGSIRLYDHNTKSLSRVAETNQMPQGFFALDYDRSTTESGTLYFLTSHARFDKAELFMVTVSENEEPQMKNITVSLPKRFIVGDASLICGNRYLALGSQGGSLAIYQLESTESVLQPVLNEYIHPEGINKVESFYSLFGEAGRSQNFFFTCGRDGFYGIHTLDEKKQESQGQSVSLLTFHRSTPLPRYNIAGAYVDKVSGDLMLHGFSGTDFILWNESTHSESARMTCGGSHRIWAFQPSYTSPGSGLLVWLQNHLTAFQIQGDANWVLRAGSHGREIKTMCVSPPNDERGTLYATGAEDTALRIFAPIEPEKESRWGAFKCLRVLTQHQTGFQHVAWSKDGKFLFTGAANEEFFVWRIRSIPLFGLVANLVASSPKSHPSSDLRVTSFDMIEIEGAAEGDFLLCLSYSNSTLRIFRYTSSASENSFTLLAKGTYTSNCLTEAQFILRDSSLVMLTASTDGYLTLWNLTSVIDPFFAISADSSTLRVKQPIDAATITPEEITCENRYQIHSNSIKAVEIVHISDAASLIIAGSDDNALTLSLLNTNFTHAEASDHAYTVSIPDAHTACVTTIKVLDQQLSSDGKITHITAASSGNDHRVKIWKIEVDAAKEGFEAIQVQNVIDRYSTVADISTVDMIRETTGDTKLLVCGVGMEMMGVQLH